ncbi:hypothetical protein DERF_008132 [Dermatophagoides farinae]|uniref:Uncharacterized protein n=1 Tax=Dermatophagoides farinae TaxID=6954 RepID=A0A922I0Y4_DERFA|nr:hypothetical protein DERF_008132 [Dermatophagoides farinae]
MTIVGTLCFDVKICIDNHWAAIDNIQSTESHNVDADVWQNSQNQQQIFAFGFPSKICQMLCGLCCYFYQNQQNEMQLRQSQHNHLMILKYDYIREKRRQDFVASMIMNKLDNHSGHYLMVNGTYRLILLKNRRQSKGHMNRQYNWEKLERFVHRIDTCDSEGRINDTIGI